jgi:two-component system chemotaxis sensor kinase CheA
MNITRSERDEIAVMKDSLKIGLFFMDKNFIIQDHYSRYLEEMLPEKDISGKNFISLLSASFSETELENIRDYFEMVFNNSFSRDILDDINPLGEFHFVNYKTGEKKVFNCNFSVIEEAREKSFILAAIYDVTARVELQQKLAEEENRRQEEMKNVFELLQVEPKVFNDFLEDAEYEFERINKTLKNDEMSPHEALVEIYQSVHAVKANAVVLKLSTFSDKAHKLESKIRKLRELDEVPFLEMLNLAIDLEKLFLEKEGFKTTIGKINSFKYSGNTNHGQNVLFELLEKTIEKTSRDLGKKVKFVIDEVSDKAIEKVPRRIIKEVLIQLARNSVAHGIEKPEERGEKNETGVIRLSIKPADGNIHVKLGDDGRGLDYGKIAERAMQLNLIKPRDAEDKNILLKVIFTPGFSTAETEGIHAGRGIGLSLVQDRVRGVKGSIKVQSEPGKGTVFNIFFPAG